jgi:hypothetical protein
MARPSLADYFHLFAYQSIFRLFLRPGLAWPGRGLALAWPALFFGLLAWRSYQSRVRNGRNQARR